MNGLQYLRKCTNMTAEEFGKMIGVSRPMISKWERGLEHIPEKHATKLYELFKCEREILEKEVDESAQLMITNKYYQYQMRKNAGRMDGDLLSELDNLRMESRIRNLTEYFYQDPDFLELAEKLICLTRNSNNETDRGRLRFMLTLIELHMSGREYNLIIGKSNYKQGLIAKDDPLAKIMLSAMDLALKNE